MNKYWKNFIKYSDPNDVRLEEWSKYNGERKSVLIFNNKKYKDSLINNWDDNYYSNQVLSMTV